MIVIYPAKLKIEGDSAIISAEFESQGRTKELWYKVPAEYENYLVTERLDAFLIGLLFLGLKTGQDIVIKGMLSSQLNYTINEYLIPVLCLGNPDFKKINITSEKIDDRNLNIKKFAATGASCGIDFFATYYAHNKRKDNFKIKFLTYLNAGSHGDYGGENSRLVFQKRLSKIRQFAKDEDLEVISIDTNLSEILKMNFQKTHTLRNLSCILILQKLIHVYYYASSMRFDEFKISSRATADYDILNMAFLSTESTSLYSSAANFTRVERTAFITSFAQTHKYLDVCTNLNISEIGANCSYCDKCLRTALTLELINKLHLFKNVFHLDIYKKNRDGFIAKIIATKEEAIFNNEVFTLLKIKNQIKFKHYLLSYNFKAYRKKNNLKKIIKKKLNRK